ncbi:MAG: T9SS type A sorting domain-containing protein [Schleiferiaceae bacterium]|jgi:hypothetical protein|nr:T9SS type A sorting domain-containing protein [Schleiferiaceae bacterium]
MRILVVFLIISFYTQGQSFIRSYSFLGAGEIKAVKATTDGGFIMCGCSILSPNTNGIIIKTDYWGDTLWTQKFTHNTNNCLFDIVELSNGNFLSSGYYSSSGSLFLVELDASGNRLSAQPMLADWGQSLIEDSGGDVIIAGAELTKFDVQGNIKWQKPFSSAQAMYAIQDNGYVVAGMVFQSGSLSTGIFVAKYDSLGNNDWYKVYNHMYLFNTSNNCLLKTTGGYVISGMKYNWGEGGATLFKVDHQGDSLWTQYYGDYNRSYAVVENNLGYVLAGRTKGLSTFLMQTDFNGIELCSDSLRAGKDEESYPKSLVKTGFGYVVAGSTKAQDGKFYPGLFRTDTACVLYNVSIDQLEQENLNVKVYPNPSHNWITIKYPEEFEHYLIIDVTGKTIDHGKLQDNRVDVSFIPAGMYLLHLESSSKKAVTSFIKN